MAAASPAVSRAEATPNQEVAVAQEMVAGDSANRGAKDLAVGALGARAPRPSTRTARMIPLAAVKATRLLSHSLAPSLWSFRLQQQLIM